jgi:hypothetical protein
MDGDDATRQAPPSAGAQHPLADADVAAYAVVAHGVLTAASVVVGLTDTLLERWDELPDERRRHLVATAGEQARTVQSVLQGFVSALPPELMEPLREVIAAQIQAQAVDAATASRSDDATEASPSTSSDDTGARPHSQR